MKKLIVYIHGLEIPTVGFVDKEGAVHACARAQKTAFQGLEHFSRLGANRYLTDKQQIILTEVEDFCKRNSVKFEVIDLGQISLLNRLKLRMKGIKNPAIMYREKIFHGTPNRNDLKELLKS